MLKKPFSFWQNVVFSDEKRCASPVTELIEFFGEMEQDFMKKRTKNLSSEKRSLMFLDAIRSDGRKMLVKSANKLNVVGYLQIWKIYEENEFSGHYFSLR